MVGAEHLFARRAHQTRIGRLIGGEDGGESRAGSRRLAQSKPQTRQQQVAVLGVTQVAGIRYCERDKCPQPCDDRSRVAGPLPADQINLTDDESRIMPVAGGGFEQCCNAQAAVAACAAAGSSR